MENVGQRIKKLGEELVKHSPNETDETKLEASKKMWGSLWNIFRNYEKLVVDNLTQYQRRVVGEEERKRRKELSNEQRLEGEVKSWSLDVLGLIFSLISYDEGCWFNILLVNKEWNQAGRIAFNPSKKIRGVLPLTYCVHFELQDSIRYLVKDPRISVESGTLMVASH